MTSHLVLSLVMWGQLSSACDHCLQLLNMKRGMEYQRRESVHINGTYLQKYSQQTRWHWRWCRTEPPSRPPGVYTCAMFKVWDNTVSLRRSSLNSCLQSYTKPSTRKTFETLNLFSYEHVRCRVFREYPRGVASGRGGALAPPIIPPMSPCAATSCHRHACCSSFLSTMFTQAHSLALPT